jgi:outer membrane protein assembly factor BamB
MSKNRRTSMLRTNGALVIMIFLSTCIGACSRSAANGADEFAWPRWRGPNGDGVSKETDWNPRAPAEGPKILWKAKVGMGYSNVVINDNRLYTVGSNKENAMCCLDAETGKQIWRSKLEDFHDTQSTPAIDGGYVYVLSRNGIIACVSAKNGKVRWKKDIVNEYDIQKPSYAFAGSPIIEGDFVILNANMSGLALDKRTGNKVWGSEKPPNKRYNPLNTSTGVGYSTPVIYEKEGNRYALVSSYEALYSVYPDTGKISWLYDWDTFTAQIITDPLVFDNKVFVIQYENRTIGSALLDIRASEPNVVWTNKELWSEISSPVKIGDYIYSPHRGPEEYAGSLQCVDIKTGEVMWEEYLEGQPISLMASNGHLIILDKKGNLYIAQAGPGGYKESSRCNIYDDGGVFADFKTPPVLYRGKIYCRNYAGDLICIDVRK